MTTVVETPQVLSDAQITQFWEQGYLLVRGVISREEAAHYRDHILDLIPRNLALPDHWHSSAGRIKPMRTAHDHTFDTPELLPLWANEKLYNVAAQLLESTRLRVLDGSLGITLRNDSDRDRALSQTLHIDASVPTDVDQFLFSLAEVQIGGCFYFTDVLPEGGGIHVVPRGHRIVEEEARAAGPQGRHLHQNWKRITHLESVEVTGEAGDFALLHHLMPHGASHNRRSTPRVAQFLRWVREDQPHGAGKAPQPGRYSARQLEAAGPLGRKLLGAEPW
ncbi:Ectoine hydroxylase-related dioxygenase, phytanoyl-CoA dioxygenase (PhyH) family [Actinopolymorpha cephalotaxi]|uniref:Ectoine hydroxylase-related dioxygenase (Phytanoyl-CoA dioxygenase family) n=1 Tax=Actinopolymorpha cephalotaxi TaxID=504797 RepID=A0A1I2W2P8_9ACTN|nr:phytanoyl-CoA dioxygenase family protein [Actinopolymorpha cephalotaxi]NYH82834.1 ectoine hydroxylase-related dioxygenase (phytanoyl-CoA dioxygenase family) [Actinopolymorpha cephalotaxi]SFG94316.1 Ectoine hydroxylase-related dioxygenase, phytanoyl-CoA dioxygenase (PhyH) family [Actinopolymorpha cephalotaxi]